MLQAAKYYPDMDRE